MMSLLNTIILVYAQCQYMEGHMTNDINITTLLEDKVRDVETDD